MSSIAAAWYPCATKICWAAARSCLRRAERGRRVGRAVCAPPDAAVMSTNLRDCGNARLAVSHGRAGNCRDAATYRHCNHTVASAGSSEERAVNETGQSGETGAAESGAGADSRDRSLLNGWTRPDGAWSNAGSTLDPEEDEDVPAWRSPAPEIRPFTPQNYPPERPSGEIRSFGT